MKKTLVSDELWALAEPLLPPEPPKPKGGRPRVADRSALTGIVFVLHSGIPWETLPQELGCGSGMTCWRLKVGVKLGKTVAPSVVESTGASSSDGLVASEHRLFKRRRASSKKRGQGSVEPNPTDRGKQGTKRYLVVDANVTPLGCVLWGAHVHDSRMVASALNAIRGVRTKRRGAPRFKPQKPHANKGYDYLQCRQELRERDIVPRIARRGIESSHRLGRHRWVVERTFAWLSRFRRLRVRYKCRADIHLAFLLLGCALIT